MDTKKTRKVKLRGKHVIEVSEQIFRWREKKAKLEAELRCQIQVDAIKTLYNAPGCPKINDQAEASTPVPSDPWDIFR
jgi:hypothetical protein